MKDNMEDADLSTVQQSGKDALLVLGMHRSGTSLLAGILDRLGCKGPQTQIPADYKNPTGYHESERIFRLNDEILAAAGARWDDWQPLREGWHSSSRFNEFRTRAVELIEAEYGDASLIYLKDPRICRLLPLWRDVLDQKGYRVACILTHRHPVEVSASLEARRNIKVEPSIGMLSWLRHVMDAEVASRGLPRVFTSYASLLPNWQDVTHQAEQAFGITWPAAPHTAHERIAELIDLGLYRQRAEVDAFLRDPLVPEIFGETLRLLERWAKDGEDDRGRQILDRLRDDFDRLVPILRGPVAALQAATREAEAPAASLGGSAPDGQSDAQLEQAQEEQDRAPKPAEAVQANAAELSLKLEQTEQRETALLAEVGTWADRVIERDRKISVLQCELDQTRAQAAERQREIDALHHSYKTSTSWRISAPVRVVGRLLRGR